MSSVKAPAGAAPAAVPSAAAAASDEQAALKQRLLAKETSLRDLTKRYLQFVKSIESMSAEECATTYQALLKEIARYEFAVSKARSLIETNERQVADYDKMRQGIEADMATTQDDIVTLGAQLQEERKLRQQREQYAALAHRINQYPPREQTEAEIEQLNGELSSLKAEGEAVRTKLELRSKRFAGFTHALHDLQQQLTEEGDVDMAPAE